MTAACGNVAAAAADAMGVAGIALYKLEDRDTAFEQVPSLSATKRGCTERNQRAGRRESALIAAAGSNFRMSASSMNSTTSIRRCPLSSRATKD
jgi:hypothetical protein